jgi:hypothetical protein
MDRDETIKQIKTALQRRSGKTWSVTGGRGTDWGWITITAPPKRCTANATLRRMIEYGQAERQNCLQASLNQCNL